MIYLSLVDGEIARMQEFLIADVAAERLVARVDALVDGQVAGSGELLQANIALHFRRVGHVLLLVDAAIAWRREDLVANVAPSVRADMRRRSGRRMLRIGSPRLARMLRYL